MKLVCNFLGILRDKLGFQSKDSGVANTKLCETNNKINNPHKFPIARRLEKFLFIAKNKGDRY